MAFVVFIGLLVTFFQNCLFVGATDRVNHHLDLLGITGDYNSRDLKKRFHELALIYHPDKNAENKDEAARIFAELREAYESLLDSVGKPRDTISEDFWTWTSSASHRNFSTLDTWSKPLSDTFKQLHKETTAKFEKNTSLMDPQLVDRLQPLYWHDDGISRDFITCMLLVYSSNCTVEKTSVADCIAEAFILQPNDILYQHTTQFIEHFCHADGSNRDFLFGNLSLPNPEIFKTQLPLLDSARFRMLFLHHTESYWRHPQEKLLKSSIQTLSSSTKLDTSFANFKELFASSIQMLKDNCQESNEELNYKVVCEKTAKKVDTLKLFLPQMHYWLQYSEEVSWDEDLATDADFLRQQGYRVLDWIGSFQHSGLIIDGYLLAGMYFQSASYAGFNSLTPGVKAIAGADGTLAILSYIYALEISKQSSLATELRVNWYISHILMDATYVPDRLSILRIAEMRARDILDFYPLKPTLMNIHETVLESSKLEKQMEHLLDSRLEQLMASNNLTVIDGHSDCMILYQAYYGVMRNWYSPKNMTKDDLRLTLMSCLLEEVGGNIANPTTNLLPFFSMVELDEEGWFVGHAIEFPHNDTISVFSDFKGFQLNLKDGSCRLSLEAASAEENRSALFNQIDVVDIFQTAHSSAFVSLEMPLNSSRMSYHPFQRLIVGPDDLPWDYKNTMLQTDYILKFLTTGYQVQFSYPYSMKSIDNLLDSIRVVSPSLAASIQTYHQTSRPGTAHRFWIEAVEIPIAIDESDDEELLTYGYGEVSMRVRKHLLVKNSDGDYVDDDLESEGWKFYIQTKEQIENIRNYSFSIPDSTAMLIQSDTFNIYCLEDNKLSETDRPIPEPFRQELFDILSSGRYVTATGKIKVNATIETWMFKFTNAISGIMSKPSRFSPERILAEKLTENYKELAIVFPSFQRLQKLTALTHARTLLCSHVGSSGASIHKYQNWLREFPDDLLANITRAQEEQQGTHWKSVYDKIESLIQDSISSHNLNVPANIRKEVESTYEVSKRVFQDGDQSDSRLAEEAKADMMQRFSIKSWTDLPIDIRIYWDNQLREQLALKTSKRFASVKQAITEKYADVRDGVGESRFNELLDLLLGGQMESFIQAAIERRGPNIQTTVSAEIRKQHRESFERQLLEIVPAENQDVVSAFLNGNTAPIVQVFTKQAVEKSVQTVKRKWESEIEMRTNLIESIGSLGISTSCSQPYNSSDNSGKGKLSDPKYTWIPSASSYLSSSMRRVVYGGVLLAPVTRYLGQLDSMRNELVFLAFMHVGKAAFYTVHELIRKVDETHSKLKSWVYNLKIGHECGSSSFQKRAANIVSGSDLGSLSPHCAQHDRDYETKNMAKLDADNRFYNGMRQDCGSDKSCSARAFLFYNSVRWFGGSAFEKAQRDAR